MPLGPDVSFALAGDEIDTIPVRSPMRYLLLVASLLIVGCATLPSASSSDDAPAGVRFTIAGDFPVIDSPLPWPESTFTHFVVRGDRVEIFHWDREEFADDASASGEPAGTVYLGERENRPLNYHREYGVFGIDAYFRDREFTPADDEVAILTIVEEQPVATVDRVFRSVQQSGFQNISLGVRGPNGYLGTIPLLKRALSLNTQHSPCE